MQDNVLINVKDDPVTYINMEAVTTRRIANRVIILIIDDMSEVYPDWRFNQLLLNIGATKPEDLFYEESRATLERVLQDPVVAQWYKKYENKAEVVNFNEYKGSHKK